MRVHKSVGKRTNSKSAFWVDKIWTSEPGQKVRRLITYKIKVCGDCIESSCSDSEDGTTILVSKDWRLGEIMLCIWFPAKRSWIRGGSKCSSNPSRLLPSATFLYHVVRFNSTKLLFLKFLSEKIINTSIKSRGTTLMYRSWTKRFWIVDKFYIEHRIQESF